VRLFVNGEERTVTAGRDTALLYVLRNGLRITGPRFGCGLGQCGACNVLVDGRKTASCDTPLWACEGKHVTTVEGLGQDGELHPLQQACIDEQAAQCGYCLSGILISAKALLDANPNPTEAQIRSALDDNLCRCGSHNRIVRAVQRVALQNLPKGPG
jgi:nicotinate dehydrogenase subunit A